MFPIALFAPIEQLNKMKNVFPEAIKSETLPLLIRYVSGTHLFYIAVDVN